MIMCDVCFGIKTRPFAISFECQNTIEAKKKKKTPTHTHTMCFATYCHGWTILADAAHLNDIDYVRQWPYTAYDCHRWHAPPHLHVANYLQKIQRSSRNAYTRLQRKNIHNLYGNGSALGIMNNVMKDDTNLNNEM